MRIIFNLFIAIGLLLFTLTSCNNTDKNKLSEKELLLQKKEIDLKLQELELKEKQLAIDSAINNAKQSKKTIPVNEINLPLTIVDIKKQIAKQLLKDDKDIKNSCSDKVDEIEKEIEIESIILNKSKQQYVVSASPGICGGVMNSPCLNKWIYEYDNNGFRFLGYIDCTRGAAKASKVKSNGYCDILTTDFIYGGTQAVTYRYKYNGSVYKSAGEE